MLCGGVDGRHLVLGVAFDVAPGAEQSAAGARQTAEVFHEANVTLTRQLPECGHHVQGLRRVDVVGQFRRAALGNPERRPTERTARQNGPGIAAETAGAVFAHRVTTFRQQFRPLTAARRVRLLTDRTRTVLPQLPQYRVVAVDRLFPPVLLSANSETTHRIANIITVAVAWPNKPIVFYYL